MKHKINAIKTDHLFPSEKFSLKNFFFKCYANYMQFSWKWDRLKRFSSSVFVHRDNLAFCFEISFLLDIDEFSSKYTIYIHAIGFMIL